MDYILLINNQGQQRVYVVGYERPLLYQHLKYHYKHGSSPVFGIGIFLNLFASASGGESLVAVLSRELYEVLFFIVLFCMCYDTQSPKRWVV